MFSPLKHDEDRVRRNLLAFYGLTPPETAAPIRDRSGEEAEEAAILAALEGIDPDDPDAASDDVILPPAPGPAWTEEELERARAGAEIEPIAAPYVCRFDRLNRQRRALEADLDAAPAGEERAALKARLADVNRQLSTELERGVDETWRAREAVNEWRADAGRLDYNAARRMVRSEPNRPRTDDAEERRKRLNESKAASGRKRRAGATEEDKAAEADRKWASRQRVAGKSENEITEGLARRRAKRV